jgi:hypothetical protein
MYNQYWPWKYLHVRRHEKNILSLQIYVWSLYRFMDIKIILKVSGVMINVLTSSVVGRGFELRSGQNKEYTIVICSFSAQH